MMSQLKRMSTRSLIVVAAFTSVIMAAPVASSLIKTPPVPAELRVPGGNTMYLKGHALGTQNYICQISESGSSWKFIGPQATLFVTLEWNDFQIAQQITTHFLSPNPSENGLARATWQSSLDSSAVWAKAIASSTDANYVTPGAIPWLLLQAVGTRLGPTGGMILSQTTFVQRLSTWGGAMPTTGCTSPSDAGTTVFVPYTADYYFYKAGN
jgi:uncharacterized protein DUF3455